MAVAAASSVVEQGRGDEEEREVERYQQWPLEATVAP